MTFQGKADSRTMARNAWNETGILKKINELFLFWERNTPKVYFWCIKSTEKLTSVSSIGQIWNN